MPGLPKVDYFKSYGFAQLLNEAANTGTPQCSSHFQLFSMAVKGSFQIGEWTTHPSERKSASV